MTRPKKIDWDAPIHYKATSNGTQDRVELEYHGLNDKNLHLISIKGGTGLRIPYDDYGVGSSPTGSIKFRQVYNEEGYVKPRLKKISRLKLEPFDGLGIF